ALLGAADMAVDGVAGAERKAPDLRGRDVDVVGTGEVVGVGRTQEAEAVLEHLDDALADDLGLAPCKLLEDREHELLLAQRARVLDVELLREGKQLSRTLGFEVLQFHFGHEWKISVKVRGKNADREGELTAELVAGP